MELTMNIQENASSVEIGQSAKGEWYVKSIKLYFKEQSSEEHQVVQRLGQLRCDIEKMLASLEATS